MIRAGPVPPAPGKPRTSATSRTGTLALPTGSGRIWPGWAPAALTNALVASTGIGSRGAPAVSASWPLTGSGGTPGRWTRCPAPTENVSAAAPPRPSQEVTAGAIPGARGLARSAEDAAACHRSRVAALANGAGKRPEARGETARARTASVARTAARRCSARRAARRAGVLAYGGAGNPGSW